MSKLNVLFLNSWYPNKIQPYNGNFIQQHARAVALNCNVACLNVQAREQSSLFEVSATENKGVFEVIVYIKKISTPILIIKKLKRRHAAYKLGVKLIKKKFPVIDIVHLNVVFPAGLFALYLKNKYKIPFIITEHSTTYLESSDSQHSFLQKLVIKKAVKKAAKICPVSNDLKNAMISAGYFGDYKVIPNVVHTKHFKFVAKDIVKPIKILHISSLKEEHKNGRGMLRVIKKLSEKRQDFTFTIISDGDTLSIKKYANQINLAPNLFYVEGEKTIKEIAIAMQNFDLFLLFSNYENLPCVISESLVSGMPVIASNVGGIHEMITTENGILVTAGNETELLSKLNVMLDNLHTFNRAEIAQKAKKIYSYATVSKQFLGVYHEILKK